MSETDDVETPVERVVERAVSDAPAPPAPRHDVPGRAVRIPPSRSRRFVVISAVAAALVVAVGLVVVAVRDRSDRARTTLPPPAVPLRLCSVTPVLTPEQIEGSVRIDISAAGDCDRGFDGTLTLRNNTSGRCASDIMVQLGPTGDRLWFASTSGYGGATGRWEPVPEPFIEGVGVMEYPPGERTWPITLPPLPPGTHTFTLGIGCETTSFLHTAEFRVWEASPADRSG